MMTATSGRLCTDVLTRSDPIGSCVRTLLESPRWSSRATLLRWRLKKVYSVRLTHFTDTDSTRPLPSNASATTLKTTDMPSKRLLFQLVPLTRRTDETECSSSATGTMLKTPCAADSYADKMTSQGISGTSGTLAQEIVSGYAEKHRGFLLPTPTAIEGVKWTNTYNPDSQMGQSLSAMGGSGLLPTPAARDHKQDIVDEKLAKRTETHQVGIPEVIATLQASADGMSSRFNPLFTEEMMGFPFLWTTLPFLRQSGEPNHSKPTETQ